MIRNAKILGLAIVAVLAMTAVMASAASAANFTAAKYPVTITGTQTGAGHVFTVGSSSVTCTTATFSASASEPSETLTVVPTYANCTAFGFINSKVTGFSSEAGGGCDYLFKVNGEAALNCTSGDVKVDAGTCAITITSGKNQALKTNTYTNETPTVNQVTVDTNVTNVHAEVSGFGCPVATGTYATAKYTGTTVMSGTNEGKAVKIDVG